jgi:putative peptidoglycan lipid II flippase
MTLARNVTTVGGATLLSRLLGFLRDMLIAAALGAGALSDAYFTAFALPNLFRRLLAEGALNAAFVPVWLRIRHERGSDDARRFGESILGIIMLGLGLIALLGVVLAPEVVRMLAPGFAPGSERFILAVDFARLSIPYLAIAGVVAVAAATLNAEGRTVATALGVVTFNVALIAAVAALLASGLAATATAGVVLSSAVLLAGGAQLLLVGGALLRLPTAPRRLRLGFSPDARLFFALAIPGLIAAGIPQLKLMAGSIVASPSEAAVSWLYYAYRLYELPLGVVSVAIAAVIGPAVAASMRTADAAAVARTQARAFETALGLSLPAALALALLAPEIAGVLFERGAFGTHDTTAVAAALAAICAGLPGHALEKALGAVSFAYEDTRTPMVAALLGLTVAVAGALVMFPAFGHVGVAAAIALSGWVGATLLGAVLARRRWLAADKVLGGRLGRIVVASLAMALVLIGLQWALAAIPASSATIRAVRLAALVAAGLAAYAAALQILGVARLGLLLTAVRERA